VAAIERFPTLSAALSQVRELGFARIDLAAFEGWQNLDPSALAADSGLADAAGAAIASAGLETGAINSNPGPLLNDPEEESFAEYLKRFRALLQLAGSLRCGQLTVQPGKRTDGQSVEEALALIVRRLRGLADRARAAGVQLSVEAHEGSLLEKPPDALAVMRELWPSTGLTYDPSHFVMQGFGLSETRRSSSSPCTCM
jgi:sugar phosphate isomerase/epimerase